MADAARSGPMQQRLTLVALAGMCYWLFGNLYEAVVISPNWIEDSPGQFTRLNEFFVNTGPTLYFVPVTQLATALVWILWWRNREDAVKRDYRNAGIAVLLAMALTAYVVIAVLSKMFGDDYLAYATSLSALAWQWNVLNVFRMIFTAAAVWYLFSAFRKLDRMSVRPSAESQTVERT